MTTRNFILQYLDRVGAILREIDPTKLEEIIDVMYDAYRGDRQIFIMGNGGGAATSMHFTCDLNKTAIVPGKRRMRAMSLSDNTSLVTAWANDTNYTNIFGEQLVNFARAGDLVIGFTASGMSVNIVNGIALANEIGCDTVAFVGFDGGTVGAIAKHVLHIKSNSYQHIEDVHLLLAHVITNALQERAKGDRALETTGLGDEIQERIRRIYYVRQQLQAEPSVDRRVQMVPDQVQRTIGFDRALLYLLEDGELALRAVLGAGEAPELRLDLEADLPECQAFRDRRVVAVAEANGHAPGAVYEGMTSYAVAPIVREDRSIGVVVGGYAAGRKAVDDSDTQLLQVFAYTIRGALQGGDSPPPPIA